MADAHHGHRSLIGLAAVSPSGRRHEDASPCLRLVSHRALQATRALLRAEVELSRSQYESFLCQSTASVRRCRRIQPSGHSTDSVQIPDKDRLKRVCLRRVIHLQNCSHTNMSMLTRTKCLENQNIHSTRFLLESRTHMLLRPSSSAAANVPMLVPTRLPHRRRSFPPSVLCPARLVRRSRLTQMCTTGQPLARAIVEYPAHFAHKQR